MNQAPSGLSYATLNLGLNELGVQLKPQIGSSPSPLVEQSAALKQMYVTEHNAPAI